MLILIYTRGSCRALDFVLGYFLTSWMNQEYTQSNFGGLPSFAKVTCFSMFSQYCIMYNDSLCGSVELQMLRH